MLGSERFAFCDSSFPPANPECSADFGTALDHLLVEEVLAFETLKTEGPIKDIWMTKVALFIVYERSTLRVKLLFHSIIYSLTASQRLY